MKVKEFVDKYKVDYSTVYSATATIPLGRCDGPYEYDEADMLVAVRTAARRRRDASKASLEKAERIIANCTTPEANKIVEDKF